MAADTTLEVLFQLNSQLRGINDAINKTNELNKAQKSLGSRIDDTAKKMLKLGKAMSVGVTLPLAGAAVAATKYASDLSETVSKTQAIFKDASDDVLEWSNTSARSFGLSKRAALDAVSQFGGAFKEIGGLGVKESAKLSQQFVKLTADLNSFFNRSDAADALGSALTGEFEPLKKFNVIINDAILKQKALALGLYKGKGALSEQAKQAATVALIMEKTTDAQGDFIRTSDGLANKTRILKAEFENKAAALGENLLPLATQLVGYALDGVKAFNSLSPAMQKTTFVMIGLAAATGPLLITLGVLIKTIGVLKVASLGLAVSFKSVAAAAAIQATSFLTLTATGRALTTTFKAVGASAKFAWSAILLPATAIVAAIGAIGAAFVALTGNADKLGEAFTANLSIGQRMTLLWEQTKQSVLIGVSAIATGFITVAKHTVSLGTKFQQTAEFARAAFGEMGNAMIHGFNEVGSAVSTVLTGSAKVATTAINNLVNFMIAQIEKGVNKAIEGYNKVAGFFGQDGASLVSLGKVDFEAPEIGSFKPVDFRFDTNLKEVGKIDAELYLEGLEENLAGATALLIEEFPDSNIFNTSAEKADVLVKKSAEVQKQLEKTNKLLNPTAPGGSKANSDRLQRLIDSTRSEAELLRRQFESDRAFILQQTALTEDEKNNLILAKRAELDQRLYELRSANGELSIGEHLAEGIPSLDQQMKDLATGGFQDVSNAIGGLIDGSMTWGQAFSRVGKNILNTLVQIGVQRTAMWLLGQTQQKVSTATQVASGAQIAAANAPAAAATSIATFGTSSVVGALAATAAIAGIIAAISGAFNEGGVIPGGISKRDNQLALVASGERVIRNGPSQQYASLLDGINAGQNPIDLLGIQQSPVELSAGALPEVTVESAGTQGGAQDVSISLLFEQNEFMDRMDAAIDERVVSAFDANKSQFIT